MDELSDMRCSQFGGGGLDEDAMAGGALALGFSQQHPAEGPRQVLSNSLVSFLSNRDLYWNFRQRHFHGVVDTSLTISVLIPSRLLLFLVGVIWHSLEVPPKCRLYYLPGPKRSQVQ